MRIITNISSAMSWGPCAPAPEDPHFKPHTVPIGDSQTVMYGLVSSDTKC